METIRDEGFAPARRSCRNVRALGAHARSDSATSAELPQFLAGRTGIRSLFMTFLDVAGNLLARGLLGDKQHGSD